MPSTVIGTEIKVRKCLETLFQSLKDISVYHKIPLLNIRSLDKLDIKLQTHSSHFCSLFVTLTIPTGHQLTFSSRIPEHPHSSEGLRQSGRLCFPYLYPVQNAIINNQNRMETASSNKKAFSTRNGSLFKKLISQFNSCQHIFPKVFINRLEDSPDCCTQKVAAAIHPSVIHGLEKLIQGNQSGVFYYYFVKVAFDIKKKIKNNISCRAQSSL